MSDISINHPGSRRLRTQRASCTDANRPPLVTVFFLFISNNSLIIVINHQIRHFCTRGSAHIGLSPAVKCAMGGRWMLGLKFLVLARVAQSAQQARDPRSFWNREVSRTAASHPPYRRRVLLWVIVLEAIELLRIVRAVVLLAHGGRCLTRHTTHARFLVYCVFF